MTLGRLYETHTQRLCNAKNSPGLDTPKFACKSNALYLIVDETALTVRRIGPAKIDEFLCSLSNWPYC